MKAHSISFILFFIFCFLKSFSQERLIKLDLQEGYEYIFDLSEKNYVQKENGEKGQTTVRKKQLKIITENVIPGIIIKVRVNISENYSETNYKFWKQRIDYIFNDFRNTEYLSNVNPESIFSSSILIFQIDLVHRKIELQNKADLLESYFDILSKRNSDDIEKKIDIFNKFYLTRIENLIEYLLWFHDSQITAEGKIINSILQEQFVLKEKSKKQFNFSNNGGSNIEPDKAYKYFSVNIENGLLVNYKFIKKDSIQNKYGQNVGEYLFNVTEKNYQLISNKKINKGNVIVRGKIKNPLSNKLYFRYLNEPFGVNFKKQTAYLNDNGFFRIELDLKHAGFIYIENQNPNRHQPSASYVLYADKGDSIVFYNDLNFPEKPVEFDGSRISENIFLDKVKRSVNIFNSGAYFDNWNHIYYDYRGFTEIVLDETKSIPDILKDLLSEFESVNRQLLETKNELDTLTYRFIHNEIKGLYYGLVFQYLAVATAYEKDDQFKVQIPESIQRELKANSLNSFYNDYGFYSRNCVNRYVRYKYLAASQINNPSSAFRSYLIQDLNQHIQFSRMILAGSPLYREIAASLEQSFTQFIYLPWKDYSGHILNGAVDYLNLITKNCYDAEIVGKVEGILYQYKQLQNRNPEIKKLLVYNEKQEKLKLGEIIQKSKPTVVLFATDFRMWILSLENDSKENPEINFVRIAQASSAKEWIDYNELAKPKVPSYLYLNDSVPLEDIFLKSRVFAVFNKKGDLINYTNDTKSAIKLAKQSLTEKKQLNKSQLILIIWVLGILILLTIVVFAIWKWRVRQRFRKEAQIRKLRELELTAIRSQMNPHFLFNCLNSVQNLVQQNKGREAHLYLADFAGLIRKVLQNSEKEEVSLVEELEMTEQYLSLEKLRFDFEFQIHAEQGIDINNTMVPSMLLQPFAENAVIHGLQNKPENRQLRIEVLRKGEKEGEDKGKSENKGIIISIEDNGIGRAAAKEIAKVKNGKGSRLIQERLEILQQKQGEKYELETIDLEEGTRVEIFIPEEK